MKKIIFSILILISIFSYGQNSITFDDGSTIKTVIEGDTVPIRPSGPSYYSQIYYTTSGTSTQVVDYSIVQINGGGNIIGQDNGFVYPYRNQNPQIGTVSYVSSFIYTKNNNSSVSKTVIITLQDLSGSGPHSITLYINPKSSTGIENISPNIFSVYPNPTSSTINISDVSNYIGGSVSLFDLTGKLIIEKQSIESLDISEVETGTYTLNIIDKNGSVIQRNKIVKITK